MTGTKFVVPAKKHVAHCACRDDLLAALEDLVWVHDNKRNKPHDVWEAARAAIARAKGES